MKPLLPFLVAIEDAKRRIDAAHNRDHIEYLRIHEGGVLRGYYLAGFVCKVEYDAGVHQLQRAYEKKLLTAEQEQVV